MKGLTVALASFVLLLLVHVLGSVGSAHQAKPVASTPVPPAQQRATAPTRTTTTTQTTATVTATRTDCHWRRYVDGAIGTDPDCAPGEINAAVPGHLAQTICSPAWVAIADRRRPSPATEDRLLIEYQLPGSPAAYVVALVVPVEDGGSPTSPLNLYPLPLNGYGGQRTRTMVADQLHDEICSDKITVADGARTLEGDWLSKGLPDDD